ncbi:MAG: acyl carrier protein [Solobacterium sp.]|nr:acyl carrier protein [Solobacterium sp.]
MERLPFLKQLAMNYGHVSGSFDWDTTFHDLGMDSYDVVDFMLSVEETLGFAVEDDALLSLETMRDVESLIEQCMEEDNSEHA